MKPLITGLVLGLFLGSILTAIANHQPNLPLLDQLEHQQQFDRQDRYLKQEKFKFFSDPC